MTDPAPPPAHPFTGNVTFLGVEKGDDTQHWRISMKFEDNALPTLFMLPYDAMEWRAAEYGIDPSDVDTLLDIVVTEPFMTADDWGTDSHLYGSNGTFAESTDEARGHHISRAARVKLRHRMTTRGAGHVLNVVRQQSPMSEIALDLKREHVSRARKHAADTFRGLDHSEENRINRLANSMRNHMPKGGNGGNDNGTAPPPQADKG